MAKVRNLVQKENCSYRGYLDGMKFQSSKSKEYYIAITLKKVLELLSLKDMANVTAVKGILDQNLPREIFVSKSEREKDLELFLDQIVRYANWQLKQGKEVLRKLAKQTFKYGDDYVTADADLILEGSDGVVEVIKIRRKAPEMTLRGRMKNTDPKQSLELYFLQKLGKELYPDKTVFASVMYLANKEDKEAFGEFEAKKGKNVISHSFDGVDSYSTDINLRLEKIFADKGSANSQKCESSSCEMCQFKNLCKYTHIDNSKLEVVTKVQKAKDVKLTFQQKEFIKFDLGYCRVNAVAGAGKTTVNALRVISLIKTQYYSPKDFLLITFTEKGVREIREKLAYWIDVEGLNIDVNDFAIKTFNGFGYDMIKEEYRELGFSAEPQILDKLDRYDIIANILDEEDDVPGLNYRYPLMDLWSAKGAIVKTAELFDTIKNNGFTFPEELVAILGVDEEYAYRMFKMYIKFQQALREGNYVQYQDQIKYCIDLLSIPEMIEKYGYKHITIDEFQDTDANQLYIIKQLIRYSKFVSLVVCGDDSQSIFSWRGTSQENILNFHKEFAGTKDIFLKNNFRSTRQISRLANELNSLNTQRIKKDIVSARDGIVPVLRSMNTSDVVELIKSKISAGIPLYEIGVIARTKAELLEIEKALKLENISCLLAITELLRDNDKVKNILGFSNFLVDQTLDLHFAEMLQITQTEAFNNASDLKVYVEEEKNKFLGEYEQLSDEEKVEYIYKLLAPLGVQDRAVGRLLGVCKSKKFTNPKELADFLVKVEKYSSEIAIEKDEKTYNAVVLTTAHASKGREFLFVIGLMDDFSYDTKNLNKLEEERRLLFVTITRAKEELVLAYQKKNGFVDEVDKLLF